MKHLRQNIMTLTVTAGLMLAASGVRADSVKLHHAQSRALLSFGVVEVNVLNGALSAREFDLALTNQLVETLANTIKKAKKHVDRTTDLLSEKQEKNRPKLEKLRKHLVDAERQVDSLKQDVESQVKPYIDFAENGEEGQEAPPAPNWELLKKHLGWMAFDLGQAQRLHRGLAKKLRVSKYRTPRKPKGSRN